MYQSLQICNLNCRAILGKEVLMEEKIEINSEESLDGSSPYLNPGSICGATPSASQHCFKSGDTTWISGLFPDNCVYLH